MSSFFESAFSKESPSHRPTAMQNVLSSVSMCWCGVPHPRMRHSSPKKHRQIPRGRFRWKSFARALTHLLQLPRCCNGNAWFFGYLFFCGFFFAFGTEITRRSNLRYCRFNTFDRHEVLSALPGLLLFLAVWTLGRAIIWPRLLEYVLQLFLF